MQHWPARSSFEDAGSTTGGEWKVARLLLCGCGVSTFRRPCAMVPATSVAALAQYSRFIALNTGDTTRQTFRRPKTAGEVVGHRNPGAQLESPLDLPSVQYPGDRVADLWVSEPFWAGSASIEEPISCHERWPSRGPESGCQADRQRSIQAPGDEVSRAGLHSWCKRL